MAVRTEEGGSLQIDAGHHMPAKSDRNRNSEGAESLRWRVKCMAVLGPLCIAARP
jgi:hypothetical protein